MNPIDWSAAPEWATWWTSDRHGTCWFEFEPDYGGGCWRNSDEHADGRIGYIAFDGGPSIAVMQRPRLEEGDECQLR